MKTCTYSDSKLSPGEWEIAATESDSYLLDGNENIMAALNSDEWETKDADATAFLQLKPALRALWHFVKEALCNWGVGVEETENSISYARMDSDLPDEITDSLQILIAAGVVTVEDKP